MSHRELPKTYDPHEVEQRWYEFWAGRDYFHARVDDPAPPYTIVIPPPNVTGSLHVGHALTYSLQDILIRWRRMQGRNTLWVPGMDHAGIATQNVVERQLAAEGLSREALGREKFIERIWAWKEQSGGTILRQLRRLGASCDWERTRFTMDEGLSKAVREVFVRLHEDGLLYRGERLINWCPRCLTALSDIEVEHEEITGKLYTIRYPLAGDPSRFLLVATTRPETMLGDTAVAVHPEDDRYKDLIGKRVALPLTSRTIPVVGDAILVDREFGTGAVKITPAHDFNDFEAGERWNLTRINLLDIHARMSKSALQLKAHAKQEVIDLIAGLPVAKARPIIEELLGKEQLLLKVEPHKMALGKCYRCKTVVEPFLSTQWFVKIKPLAQPAIDVVERDKIKIIPEAWKNNYLAWMRDIKDWCISRQIWWGHRIPAWYCRKCYPEDELSKTIPDDKWKIPPDATPIVPEKEGEVPTCKNCGNTELIQDPDVLDTWFSSALWPFSTLSWPEQTADLKKYYPTSTLVTGLDILFFWVARMIMMGLKFMGEVPFREVYIHALVRDAEGQKMSKSKGNVIDPLHVMEQYGTDALRFTLASMSTPGRDIKLAEERIEGYRNFANKIWNAARFILMNLDGPIENLNVRDRSFPDRWILDRLNTTILRINSALESYRFDQAAGHLYQFIWHDYCDWYLELVKPDLQHDREEAQRIRATLVESFETIMRLLHPFMPFITEEIWQTLPHSGPSIMIRPYPTTPIREWDSKSDAEDFEVLEQFVTVARAGRSLLHYPPGKSLTLFGHAQDHQHLTTLNKLHPHLEHLSKGTIELSPSESWSAHKVLKLPGEFLVVGIVVESDVDLKKVRDRIVKQSEEGKTELARVNGKLFNTEFLNKAPLEVVSELRNRHEQLEHQMQLLSSTYNQIESMIQSRST